MKRFFRLLTVTLILAALLACSAQAAGVSVVTTIFPIYDWTVTLLGDNPAGVEVVMLQSNGIDLHNFQPSAADILKIARSDLFIYVGGESDAWAEPLLANAAKGVGSTLVLMDALGESLREEETVEGMEAEEEEDGDEAAYDEHVWLSLRNARVLCEDIADALCELTPEYAGAYRENLARLTEEIDALDGEYAAAVEGAARKVILFGDRFPFRYLTEDYGLEYYAAFLGCSAETEASFNTVVFLAGKVNELELPVILALEGTEHQLAETIRRATKTRDQQILTMNSIQGVAEEEIARGVHYLDLMRENLETLKQALQ